LNFLGISTLNFEKILEAFIFSSITRALFVRWQPARKSTEPC
jgi:hypothetical protein